MITVKLQGGLGNQLFQYAAALALAHHQGTGVAFDLSFFQNLKDTTATPRSFGLDAFGLLPVQPPLADRLAYGLTQLPFRRTTQRLVRGWHPVTEYREHSFRYDPSISACTSRNTHLTGYFQSELYFKAIETLLRSTLEFQKKTKGGVPTAIRATNSVSLHIRRGDYANNPTTHSFHGLCSLHYYQNAAAYLAGRVSDIHFFIFSDHQAWAREHLLLPYRVTFVEGHAASQGYNDMELMSLCRHHIIANSSFSWWGAWLNTSPDKIVVAPKQWFADETAQNQSVDLIPKAWIQM